LSTDIFAVLTLFLPTTPVPLLKNKNELQNLVDAFASDCRFSKDWYKNGYRLVSEFDSVFAKIQRIDDQPFTMSHLVVNDDWLSDSPFFLCSL